MRSGELFFVTFLQGSFQGRFMSLFLEDRGLSGTEIGAVLSISALISIFAAPAWTLRADMMARRDSKELLLCVSVLGSGVFFAAQCLVDLGVVPLPWAFAHLFACRVLASIFSAPRSPLVNAVAIEDLQNEHGDEGSMLFGRERLWGAVSWAVMHQLQGFLIEWYGTWTMYVGHAIGMVLTLWTLHKWMIEKHHNADEKRVYLEKGQHPEGTACCGAVDVGLARILCHGPVNLAFFFLMLTSAAGMSLVENLLFLLFANELKAGAIVCGLSVVITVVCEIPLFRYGRELLNRHGVPTLITLAVLAYVVRVVMYTLMPEGWYVLLVEPLHGVTIALMDVASNEFITRIAPPNRRTTAQGLLSSVRTGLGFFVGTLSGGWIIDHYGEATLYRSYAAVVGFSLLLYVAALQMAPLTGRTAESEPLLGKQSV